MNLLTIISRAALAVACSFTLVACAGGGSEGTGSAVVTRTFRGSVKTEQTPLPGVRVALLESNASAVTDAEGFFSFDSELPSTQDVTLELLTSPNAAPQTIAVPIDDPDSRVVSVAIQLNAQKLVQTVSRFYMWARIVGDCARYFANEAVIRQRRATPPELACTMRFFVNGDLNRLERIPGQMQVRACDSTTWRPLTNGQTGIGTSAGVGDIDFTFIDNERNCEYRVVAPFHSPPLPELTVRVATLTLQHKKK